MHSLSSGSFSCLIFSLLVFSSLTLPTAAFSSVNISADPGRRKGPRPQRDLLELQESLPRPEWRVGAAGKGLASFQGWQTAALNPIKGHCHGLSACWSCRKGLPQPEWRLGAEAAGKVCRDLSGAWELQGLASFQNWQTAALNPIKGHCHSLRDLLELQERSAAA